MRRTPAAGFTLLEIAVALAILGVVVHHPFGLQLNTFENAFHWTVGPLTLGLGLAAVRASGFHQMVTGGFGRSPAPARRKVIE